MKIILPGYEIIGMSEPKEILKELSYVGGYAIKVKIT